MNRNELEIIQVEINKIKENPLNAKIHSTDQVLQIQKSIEQFGFNDPIAVDEDFQIIEGHGRLIAAKNIGMTEVPIIVLYGLTEEQKAAYSLIHNKLTLNTPFDKETLKRELDSIKKIDMSDFSFQAIDETLFDDSEEHEKTRKIIITAIVAPDKAACLSKFLDKNKIKYKESLENAG